MESGRIRPSKSPFASPFFFVKKKDGMLHPVQDYCKLNEMMIKNQYPLPLISELIDKLCRARYFTKLDVRWGIQQCPNQRGRQREGSISNQPRSLWTHHHVLRAHQFACYIPMMMNDIFRNLIAEGKVTIYLDDILIFSKDLKEHRKVVQQFSNTYERINSSLRWRSANLRCWRPNTSGWSSPKTLSGWTPSRSQELPNADPDEEAGATVVPRLHQFLLKFIKNYSKVVKALTALTRNAEWKWGSTQD